jgi:SAM-dependent methyltransferase
MSNKEDKLTARRYRRLFDEHGQSHKSLNWGSQEGQYLRFRILAEIGVLEGKRILDVGCGLGDFAGWLSQNNIRADYTGLDLTPELVEQAHKSYPKLNFIQGSILDESLLAGQQFDFVFTSGIFYTYSIAGDAWLRSAVSRMWGLCKEGVAFNSLSAWAQLHDANEYYADPSATLEYCRTLTSWVAMRHDYHPRDFTIYLSRRARQ